MRTKLTGLARMDAPAVASVGSSTAPGYASRTAPPPAGAPGEVGMTSLLLFGILAQLMHLAVGGLDRRHILDRGSSAWSQPSPMDWASARRGNCCKTSRGSNTEACNSIRTNVDRAMSRTTGKRNAHLRSLFPIPTHVQEVLEKLPEEDQLVVHRYLIRIRAAAMGYFRGPVPLHAERAGMLDRMEQLLAAAPGMPPYTAALRVVQECDDSKAAQPASLARWLVNARKKRQARG